MWSWGSDPHPHSSHHLSVSTSAEMAPPCHLWELVHEGMAVCCVPESKEFHRCRPQLLGIQLVGGASVSHPRVPARAWRREAAWIRLCVLCTSVGHRFLGPGTSNTHPSCGQVREELRQEAWGKPTVVNISRTLTHSALTDAAAQALLSRGPNTC